MVIIWCSEAESGGRPASYINQYGNNQPYENFNTKIVNQHDQVVWK